MQPVLEIGDDPEVPAATAQRPEKIRALRVTCGDEFSPRRDDICREQAVAGHAIGSAQPPLAATERETGDTGRRNDSSRDGEAERLRLAIEVAPRDPCLRAHRSLCGIDADASERREVDDQAAVTGTEPRDVVAAAANRQEQIVVAREPQRLQDVRNARALHDNRGPLIDEPVPDAARLLVLAGALDEHAAGHAPGERVDHRGFERDEFSGQRACECHGRLTTAAIVPGRGDSCYQQN